MPLATKRVPVQATASNWVPLTESWSGTGSHPAVAGDAGPVDGAALTVADGVGAALTGGADAGAWADGTRVAVPGIAGVGCGEQPASRMAATQIVVAGCRMFPLPWLGDCRAMSLDAVTATVLRDFIDLCDGERPPLRVIPERRGTVWAR